MSLGEDHYTVNELAKMLKISRTTVVKLLQQYVELIPNVSKKRRSRYGPIKRHHANWRIPKSVAEKMYRDLTGTDETAA